MQDTDSTIIFVSDSDDEKMPVTRAKIRAGKLQIQLQATERETPTKGAVHSRIKSKPQNDLKLLLQWHNNPRSPSQSSFHIISSSDSDELPDRGIEITLQPRTEALVYNISKPMNDLKYVNTPQDPCIMTKLVEMKRITISNTNNRKLSERKNKQVPEIRDGMKMLSSRKLDILRSENKTDGRKESCILSRRRSPSESSLHIISSSDSDELPDRRMETNFQAPTEGAVNSIMKSKPQNDLKLIHVIKSQDPPILTKLDEKKPIAISNTNNWKLSEKKNKQVPEIRDGMKMLSSRKLDILTSENKTDGRKESCILSRSRSPSESSLHIISSSDSDELPDRRMETNFQLPTETLVCNMTKSKPKNYLKLIHVNKLQGPRILTKLDEKKPTTISNTNNWKLSERKNKQVPEIRDGMKMLSSRKLDILRSENKTDGRKESCILSRRRSPSESSFHIISSSDSDELPDRRMETNFQAPTEGAVNSIMKSKPQIDLKLIHVIKPQDPPILTKLNEKKPIAISNTNNWKLSERKNKQVPEIRDGMKMLSSRKLDILRSENKTDGRKESCILSRSRSPSESSFHIISSSDSDELPDRRMETNFQTFPIRSISESSFTSIGSTSDSDELSDRRMKTNLQEKRDIYLEMAKEKENEMIASTPLHGKIGIKMKNWPSPIAELHSRFIVAKKRNVYSKYKLGNFDPIYNTLPQGAIAHDQNKRSAIVLKESAESQNGNLDSDSDKNVYPPSSGMQENESELRLLTKISSRTSQKSDENSQAKSVTKKSVHIKDTGDMKRLKQNTPEKINRNIKKIRDDEGEVIAGAPIKQVNSRKVIKNVDDSPEKVERNPHKEESHTMITGGKRRKAASDYDDDEGEVIAGASIKQVNFRRLIKYMDDSPEKVEKNSHSEESHTMLTRGKMSKTTSDYSDKTNNDNTEKENNNKRRKATDYMTLSNYETKGKKDVPAPGNGKDDEGEVIARAPIKQVNSRKVMKNVDDSPEKVERNPHKEESHTMFTRGKRRKTASNYDDKTNNDNTEKENNNKRRKATDHITLSNYETNRRKDVAAPGNGKDDEGEVIARAPIKQVNSRKVMKNVDDSPEKVERNPHKEESHTMFTRGKRRKAASDYDDKTSNNNTEKENNNKRRKATDHTTLSNYETNRKKDVAVPGNGKDDEGEVIAGASIKQVNSRKVIENVDDSPEKVERNSHKEESHNVIPSGKRRKAASDYDDKMNNNNTEKENNNKRRKATDHTTLSNYETNREKDVAAPGNGEGLRRSKRTRVRPVAYWTGESVKYKTGSDRCRQVIGINPGRCPENYSNFVPKKKKFAFKFTHLLADGNNLERKLIPVPFMGKERKLECFSTLRFDGKLNDEPEQKVCAYTGLEIPRIGAGYISIAPSSYMTSTAHDNIFVFCIITGTVSVTIHRTKKTLRNGEFFCIPEGVSYQIENIAESEAVLSFTNYES